MGGWSVTSIVTAAIRISVHAATELQPVAKRRYEKSRAAVHQSGFQRARWSWELRANGSIPAAFIAQPNNSGFYGNAGRDTLIGPGLATWDFSVMKNTAIHERLNLQFRAEIFNLLDRANFNTPNLIVAVLPATGTTPIPNPAAGQITSTSTTARQVQFG